MIDSLRILVNKKIYDFTTINKDMLGTKSLSNSFKILFRNHYLTSIKKLYLVEFAIDSLTVKAFSNLLNLKEVIIFRINCENTFFQVLFCVLQEYQIKRLEIVELNISEKDLIFIANLKKIEKIIFWRCNIQ
ncbi:hypothetical protein CWI36_0914p0020 [Hamiltosporidium magnivora]|uniref:Uncharacterized protein n=1 Tax=Hamiltosporidium magnivora TaxID=148818 RepID=A0A4Q9L980_9MICR|nr:hypothetical protein CWI36_0914p0020 [Hamiltosporidium magnivora]